MTASLLPTFGIKPLLGRAFLEEEDRPGHNGVAIVSYAFWQNRLGGKSDVIGQVITLDGNNHTIVGVLAAGTFFPGEIEIAIPMAANFSREDRTDRDFDVYGRLKAGVSLEQADAELKAIAAQIALEYPKMSPGWSTRLMPLSKEIVGPDVRTGLFMLLGAVALLLLIACANFSNLLLVRASSRAHEIAVRIALGASRGRVISQLITESLAVTVIGGLLGVLLSLWAIGGLRSLELPRAAEISIDLRVLVIACAITLIVGCLAGIGPAMAASQTRPQDALKGRSSRGGHRSRLRDGMVIAQLALSLALVIGATTLIRSFWKLTQVNPGFSTEGVLTVSLRLINDERAAAFYEQVTARIATLPDVAGVGLVSNLPLTEGNTSNSCFPIGPTVLPAGQSFQANWRLTDGGYFEALQIPLIRGRTFAGLFPEKASSSVVLSNSLAKALFGVDDPIGRQIANGGADGSKLTIIGVVGDVRGARLGAAPQPTFYMSMHRFIYGPMRMAVRTRGEIEPLTKAIRAVVKEIDPNVPVFRIRTMDEFRSESVARERLTTALLGAFAVTALALAGLGIYGVIAFTVQERRREIGIRLAIGAQGRDILRLIFGDGLRLVAIGMALGLAGAVAAGRLLASLFFLTSTTDPASCLLAGTLLALTALAASVVPTLRAARTDPVVALRAE
jgi:putative ABC transport system permease protein